MLVLEGLICLHRSVLLQLLACECPGVSGEGVGWWWPAAGLEALSVEVGT